VASFIYIYKCGGLRDKVSRIEEILCIDLTAAFGVGNEPTVEEMDELMTYFPDGWFDGTVNLPTMTYLLKQQTQLAKSNIVTPELYNRQLQENKINELAEKLTIANRNLESIYKAKTGTTSSSQTIAVKNAGRQKMILHLHKRANNGYDTANDVYLPNAENDFSDVRIKTDNGEILPYHVVYKGNIDIIPDKRLGIDVSSEMFTDSNKNMIVDINGRISKSEDNGFTWETIPALEMIAPNVAMVTSDDIIFFSSYGNKGKLLRSAPPYTSYSEVLDTNPGYTSATILSSNIVEHPDGELLFGSYQSERMIRIYKSTDRGLTWDLIYSLPETYQHVHALFVDIHQDPVAIYAGVDGGGGVLKSIDKGQTWVDLREYNPDIPQSTDRGVLYSSPNGYRLLGGETAIVGGYSIIKTTDDVNYTPVLGVGCSVFQVNDLNGKLIASSNSAHGYAFEHAAIYISEDEGDSWVQAYTTQRLTTVGANDGFRYMAKDIYASTDYEQIIVGCQSPTVSPLRIISGEDTYYAEVIVEVPDGCTELTVESGYLCSNETFIGNDFEVSNEKIVSLALNEGGRYIKESVSGKIIEGDFSYHNVGRHLSFNYPYITATKDRYSMKLSSLTDGIDVDASLSGLSAFTISFWARLGKGVNIDIISSPVSFDNNYLRIVGFQLHGSTYICTFRYPTNPDAFMKFDIVVDVASGVIKTYSNGRYIADSTGKVISALLTNIAGLTKVKLLKVDKYNENDAIQHFNIYNGALSESDIYNSYHDYISDNQH